jgi:hypothetical protein
MALRALSNLPSLASADAILAVVSARSTGSTCRSNSRPKRTSNWLMIDSRSMIEFGIRLAKADEDNSRERHLRLATTTLAETKRDPA